MGILKALLGKNSAIPDYVVDAADDAERSMRPSEREALELATRGNANVTINIFVMADVGAAADGHVYGHEGSCR